VTVAQAGAAIRLTYREVGGAAQRLETDMVVLATAMKPPGGTAELAALLDLPLTADGFAACENEVLAPIATAREGIFLAGCIQGPKDIPAAVAQGQAAAGRIQAILTPGRRLQADPVIVHADEAKCSGCGLCIDLCPYGALSRKEDSGLIGLISVEPLICRGCGTCVPACPSAALIITHFSDSIIEAEIDTLAQCAKGPYRDQR
jgi:heterodisulfide reductase subunit A